jgi:hypothetical protein
MPVVRTTRSGGVRSTSAVARSVASLSCSSEVCMTGPCTTCAPRRASISACSSHRRWPVMPIVKPVSAPVTPRTMPGARFGGVSARGSADESGPVAAL